MVIQRVATTPNMLGFDEVYRGGDDAVDRYMVATIHANGVHPDINHAISMVAQDPIRHHGRPYKTIVREETFGEKLASLKGRIKEICISNKEIIITIIIGIIALFAILGTLALLPQTSALINFIRI